jgi:hypothetical protein
MTLDLRGTPGMSIDHSAKSSLGAAHRSSWVILAVTFSILSLIELLTAAFPGTFRHIE